jgi:hypothetical protein
MAGARFAFICRSNDRGIYQRDIRTGEFQGDASSDGCELWPWAFFFLLTCGENELENCTDMLLRSFFIPFQGAKRPPSPPSPSLFAHINHPLPIPVLPSPSPSLSSPPHSPNSLPAYPDASFDYPEGLDEMEVDEDEDRLAAERMEEQWRVEERVEEEGRTRRPRRAAAVAAEAGMRSM